MSSCSLQFKKSKQLTRIFQLFTPKHRVGKFMLKNSLPFQINTTTTGLILALLLISGCETMNCPPDIVNLPTNQLRQRANDICETEEKIATNLYFNDMYKIQ